MKFFKSKFFIIIISVALLIAIVFTTMSILGYSSYIKSGIHIVLTPLQKLSDAVGRALDGYAAYFTEFDRLKAENEELKKQIDDMKNEIRSADEINAENEELRKILQIKKEHLDYKFEIADVVGREDGNYMTVFTLGKGTKNGIDEGMPMVSANSGLIGKITSAGTNWAQASTILDISTSVGAYIERSHAYGIVVGDYELGLEGRCKLAYLQGDPDIQKGDRVLTSGVGSIYPRGLIIGTVEEVKYDENLRTKYAIIKPYADIRELSSVTVVTSYEKYTED